MTYQENENDVLAGIKAQADLSLKYAQDIVTAQVTDAVLAKSVNDALATKFAAQKAAFVAAVQAEFAEDNADQDLTAPLV